MIFLFNIEAPIISEFLSVSTDHFPALCFQTRSSFIPKATIKTKRKCGGVFGFKVSKAMRFIGCHGGSKQ